VSRTVDLVIAGDEALRCGRRILVVLPSADARVGRRFRRDLARIARCECRQVTVMTNAEVVCVDGVAGVEAVVIRSARTGRLCAVNASALLVCDCGGKRSG
jgi:hypothetical protein